jgi:hypothetical protein
MTAFRPGAGTERRTLREYNSIMSLKNAALFACIGMTLLTVLLAVSFIRDVAALGAGAIAMTAFLASLIHLLASLSVTVFMYVFYKAQR